VEVLAEIGEIALAKPGRTLVVRVADAGNGNGPGIDIREHIDDSAHDGLPTARASAASRGRRWNGIPIGAELFVGFTRKEFWVQPSAAETICELLARAVMGPETIADHVRGIDRGISYLKSGSGSVWRSLRVSTFLSLQGWPARVDARSMAYSLERQGPILTMMVTEPKIGNTERALADLKRHIDRGGVTQVRVGFDEAAWQSGWAEHALTALERNLATWRTSGSPFGSSEPTNA
jgi:hypothetical protein